MHRPTLFSLAVATAALLAATPARAVPVQFRVQSLDALNVYMPGNTSVSAVNSRGHLTGGTDFGDFDALHETIILYRDGRLQPLMHDGAALLGSGNDINDRGDIVGDFLQGAHVRPFLYRNGTLLDLGRSLPAADGTAIDVNERGHVVGEMGGRTFVYDGTTSRFIPALAPMALSVGSAINDHGAVAGYMVRSEGGPAIGFVVEAGRLKALPGLGGTDTVANDINNAGQVVGFSHDAGGTLHAFLYGDGAMKDLGAGYAAAINDSGWVVGTALDAQFNADGFLYRDGSLHRLDDLLVPRAAGRWDLISGVALSDRGHVAALALDAEGRLNHLLLTPVPEPATTVLLLAGLGVVGWVAQRRR